MSNTITATRPDTVTKTITAFGNLNPADYNEAYLLGAYWKAPFLSLNSSPKFRLFQGNEDSWALSVRKLQSVNYFKAGVNSFSFSHSSGFGEFVEKPGIPLAMSTRPPPFWSRSPTLGAGSTPTPSSSSSTMFR